MRMFCTNLCAKTNFFLISKEIASRSKFNVSRQFFGSSSTLQECYNVQDGDDFKQRVLKSDRPVIVDFHAKWCGPCKILGPRLEALVQDQTGKVDLAKVDIDNNDDLAAEYQITAVPSVIGIKNGKVVDKFIGLLEDDRLKAFVDKLIGPEV